MNVDLSNVAAGAGLRVAAGTWRGTVRIALYGVPWLAVCGLGAVEGTSMWAVTGIVSAGVVVVLASVPLRSSVTVDAGLVVVANGRRVRRFARSQVVSVVAKDGYGHLVVIGRTRPVRSWALPCANGLLSAEASAVRDMVAAAPATE